MFLLAGVVTVLFVTENFVPPPPEASRPGLRGLLRDIRMRGRDRQLLVMMVVLFVGAVRGQCGPADAAAVRAIDRPC